MLSSRRFIGGAALLALLLLLTLTYVLLYTGSTADGPELQNEGKASRQNRAGTVSGPSVASSNDVASARLNELEQAGDNRFEAPVFWVGEPVTESLDIMLVNRDAKDGSVTTGQLDADKVVCDTPADGVYSFDFAEAGIYAIDHELRVVDGVVKLVHRREFVEGKIPVTRAARVEVLVESDDDRVESESVSFHWRSKEWPTRHAPLHSMRVHIGAKKALLAPLGTIEFHIDSESYYVKAPTPPIFKITSDGETLRITLSGMIPLVVNLIEHRADQWRELLDKGRFGDSAEQTVVVEAFATTGNGAAVKTMSRSDSFVRLADNAKAIGRAADRFTFEVPVPPLEVDVHVTIRLHGVGPVAAGRTTAGPQSQEIQVDAAIYREGTLTVRVEDEDSTPMSNIKVILGVGYLASRSSTMVARRVGAQRRGTTSTNGEVQFESLPVGERLFADVMVDSDYPVLNSSTRIELEDKEKLEFIVKLKTSDSRGLRVSVVDGDKSPTLPTTIVVVEGDGNGAWFRMKIHDNSSAINASVKSDYVIIVGKCGDAYFSRSAWIQDDDTTITFDLATMRLIEGKAAIPGGESATLYPYNVDASILWATTLATPSLPALALDSDRRFRVRVPDDSRGQANWHAVTPNGDVYKVGGSLPAGDSVQTELESEEVAQSNIDITLDKEKLNGATDIALLICPIYYHGPRALSVELRLGVRLEIDSEGKASSSLPHGRFVAMLTYKDSDGALRFGISSGQHAEFESRPGLTTKINLPIR